MELYSSPPCSEKESDICPISIECGLIPRRSVDFSSVSSFCTEELRNAPALELFNSDGSLNTGSMMASNQNRRSSTFSFNSRRVSIEQPECEQPWDVAAIHQPTRQQEQLAAACRSRDAKLLQQLLAAGVPISAALDSNGNTALHLLLLPVAAITDDMATGAVAQHTAAVAPAAQGAHAVLVTDDDVVMHDAPQHQQHSPPGRSTASSGGLGWLSACFGGRGAAADIPSTSSCGSQHSSSSNRAMLGKTFSLRSHQGLPVGAAAAAAAQAPLASMLIAAGAAVNVRNKSGLTPLMLAAQQVVAVSNSSMPSTGLINSALKVLDVICKMPMTDPNMQDTAGRTALSLVLQAAPAAAGSSTSSSQLSSLHHSSCSSHHSGTVHQRLLFMSPATSAAQLKAVQLLVSAGADCNSTDKSGMTPLMHAAANPAIARPVLELLLENGANARLLDNKRRSALTHALYAQNLLVAPKVGKEYALFLQGHYLHSTSEQPSERQEQQHQQPAVLGVVSAAPAGAGEGLPANHNCSCNHSHSSSIGAGTAAAMSGTSCSDHSSSHRSCATADLKAHICAVTPVPLPNHGSIIRALCSYGALDLYPGSINTRFPAIAYRTQLHIAMRRGDIRALEMLMASCADVNARDVYGNTPLMYWPVAPTEPEELVAQLVVKLLAQGASPHLANHDGWLPLDLACELNKYGKVIVKPQAVPVHAVLVGFGAKNSEAFLCQHRHPPPMLLCMRSDSDAESLLNLGKTFGSLRAVAPGDDLFNDCSTVLEESY